MKLSLSWITVLSLFLCVQLLGQKPQIIGSEWNDVVKSGRGDIVFYWYQTNPLVYAENGKITGIEYEIATSFINYLEAEYGVVLNDIWLKAERFDNIIPDVAASKGGVFGMAGISITEERKSHVQFTNPHLPDICVIVSSPNVTVSHSIDDFNQMIQGMTALTLEGSIFEKELQKIQQENNIAFDLDYIASTEELVHQLETMENGFGYVGLPSYLIELNNGTTIRRQYFYFLKQPGVSLIYPKYSDWIEPVTKYFSSAQFQEDKERIQHKYFGTEIIEMMELIAGPNELGKEEENIILTRELELQYNELLDRNLQLQEDQNLISMMILIIALVIILATIFYTRYRLKLSTNQKLALKQAEIESKNIQLMDLNEEKNHLIRVLAHDLRSPIGRMAGFAQIVMKDEAMDSIKKQEMLGYIVKDADKMNTLINKILDVDAIENHRNNLTIEDVDAVKVIDDLISDYQKTASNKHITLTKSLAHDQALIKADKLYLSQAVENLLSNAIKFSNPGTTVTMEIDDQKIIHVRDQGPGLTEDDKQKVFRKYQRLSAQPTGGESSTGIGLTTVKRFVEMMNGKITFDSRLGEGTTFHLELPMA